MTTQTPMMAQWQTCKEKAKEALLLFRLGDFYEAFHEDAKIISKEIHLTLTARQGIPMCGVPFHTSDLYIDKLIAKGYKVAIAEQTEDPKEAKGLVKREIVRIVTPGTITHSALLSDKKNNYFASLVQIGSIFGLSFVDLTTGEFRALELEQEQELLDELYRIRPAEFLVSKRFQEARPLFFQELSHAFSFVLNERASLEMPLAQETLLSHFRVKSLDGFGLKGQLAAIAAAGALLAYLKDELSLNLSALTSIQTDPLSQYMAIDRSTMRHLELIENTSDSSTKNTLLDLLDETLTPMGGRCLRHWLKHPLLSLSEIAERADAIDSFLARPKESQEARKLLAQVRDLERLINKITTASATPRDLHALALSLSPLPALEQTLFLQLPDLAPLANKILSALSDTPPQRIGEGDIFRDGYHADLDHLRKLARDSVSWMARYQNTLREQTGIKNLKVGYTKAFGYYIEVSRAAGNKIPDTFHRRQTLVNNERFITDELKEFEHQILSAEEKSRALETHLFETLRHEIALDARSIHTAAKIIARTDTLLALAHIAREKHWVRPTLDTSDRIAISEGRHPIIEASLGKASFIPNDTALNSTQQLMLITGPNMAGKSTYIRQVALIAILAQIGSYVPATSAHVGLIDKVFSRIGASDDLARGKSTFMVEMTETANILNNATSRSLVLLDEIGRGTSTYDGIAIAWAVAEFLLTTPNKQAKTLFATHYWELTRLPAEFPHAANFQTAVEEASSSIVFLRKIIPGGTDKSYGIHVAKLAGLPFKAIQRAEQILLQLETKSPRKKPKVDEQLPLFNPEPPLLDELRALDCNQLTPLQALQKLADWQKQI